MTNEAVKIEQGAYNARRYQVIDGAGITKGTLLQLQDANTASGANIGNGPAFAGIASMDKVSGDGSLDISCWTDGIFDLKCNSGVGITAGSMVVMSGANLIRTSVAGDLLNGSIVGKALETASVDEVIRVAVGRIV